MPFQCMDIMLDMNDGGVHHLVQGIFKQTALDLRDRLWAYDAAYFLQSSFFWLICKAYNLDGELLESEFHRLARR